MPKKAREILNSNIIAVEVNDDKQVILDVGGVFIKYKKKYKNSF